MIQKYLIILPLKEVIRYHKNENEINYFDAVLITKWAKTKVYMHHKIDNCSYQWIKTSFYQM